MKKIDFAIIGAQKSGSTFIHEVVAEHPQVFMPKGEVALLEDPDYHQGGLEKLWQLFEHQDENKKWGIKRPNLLGCAKCPERIYHDLDNPKLIVILRDPIKRAVAAYFHYVKDGFLPALPLEEGMKKLINHELQNKYPRGKEILNFGFYYQHLTHYFKSFSRDRILILIHEDLKRDKLKMISQVYDFLNIDGSFIPERSMNSMPQKVTYSLLRLKLLRLKNSFQWNYNDERTRLEKKRQNIFEKGVCYLISNFDRMILSKTLGGDKPFVSSHLEQELYKIYQEDIHQLEQLIGLDLNLWKRQNSMANFA